MSISESHIISDSLNNAGHVQVQRTGSVVVSQGDDRQQPLPQSAYESQFQVQLEQPNPASEKSFDAAVPSGPLRIDDYHVQSSLLEQENRKRTEVAEQEHGAPDQRFASSAVNQAQLGNTINVETHCAVLKNGKSCSRSLDCKLHSMSSKRAVAGRSQPFDMLLASYKKNGAAVSDQA
ncbi:hypothetical protein BP6252_09439 [Coleophoma cylindrospora]|uniref:SCA7 domain-containing protein n=1 Tax=Coleophoma cylindrospora TaxID=1849047 RepID=A0A3D8R1X8_9HELO|nr:hypothetical protein BP6252_09439 [Coleophoma cylindrospora]